MPASAPSARLTIATLIAYGVGEMTVTISMVLFGLFILFFYSSVMQLPPILAGLGAAAGLAWDAIVDPYIGYRSDHHRGRMGRRHGYMLVGALFTGVTFMLLLSPPRGLGVPALFAWLLVTSLLFRLAGAVFRIPYLSLGAELSSDYHERTSVAGVRAFFGLVGTLAAATLSFALFFPERVPGIDPKLDYAAYPRMGLVFGLAMTIAGVLSTLGTLQHRRQPSDASPQRQPFLRGFASAWRNRAFRSVWLGLTLFFLAVVLNAAVAIHYFTWYVRIDDSQVLSRIQLAFYSGALAGALLWVRVARRREKRSLCLIAVAVLAALMTLATLLFGEGRLFGTGDPLPLLLGTLLAGGFACAFWVLPGSMLADVADQDELETGQRREGLFFGMLNFGEKIAAGLALLLAGALLELVAGLAPGADPSPESVARIGVIYGVLPAAILAAAGVALAAYSLDPEAVHAIQSQLRRRRAGPAAPGAAELPKVAEAVGA